jgi:hypothetical protein
MCTNNLSIFKVVKIFNHSNNNFKSFEYKKPQLFASSVG